MNLMKKFFILIFTFLLFLNQCSSSKLGGSEIGNPGLNPDSAEVLGIVVSTNNQKKSSLKALKNSQCPADTIVAMNSSLQISIASVQVDCSFRLILTANKAYALSFTLENQFIASMIFNNNNGFSSSTTFVISSGNRINLGKVTVFDSLAIPENQPARQNDQDGDGINDFDDEDDNNDGRLDIDDPDCDFDGFLDDFDDQDPCDSSSSNTESATIESTSPSFAEVPGNQVQSIFPENGAIEVELNQEIQIRIFCPVNLENIDSNNFEVIGFGDDIMCNFSVSEDGTLITCAPERVLQRNTVYMVAVDDLTCEDGREINPVFWSFRTVH